MSIEPQAKDIDNIIEIAKWNMYGEEWEAACNNLKHAKTLAIALRDKSRIDITLDLLSKVKKQEKVPIV
jgi:hypothetical protein